MPYDPNIVQWLANTGVDAGVQDQGKLSRGRFPGKDDALKLVNGLELLPIVGEIEEIVPVYVSHCLRPKDAVGDALHLAIASFYGCDYTW